MGDIGLALRSDVLHQRAAERDVENLDAPTDCENGSAACAGLLDERGLGRIAGGIHRAYFFVAFLAVARGIDVLAAGQDETGDGIEH